MLRFSGKDVNVETVFEVKRVSAWFIERLAETITIINSILFKSVLGDPAVAAEIERWATAMFMRIEAAGFQDGDPGSFEMIVTPESYRQLHLAILNRVAVAERHPAWFSFSLPERIAAANRILFATCLRFAVVRSRRYRGLPIPQDQPLSFTDSRRQTHRFDIHAVSPVPGFQPVIKP